jgi:hypothetical protein
MMEVTINDLWPRPDEGGVVTEVGVTLPADATGITWDNGWTECLVIVQADHDYGRYADDDVDDPGTVIVGHPGPCDAHLERGDVWECSMVPETARSNPTITQDWVAIINEDQYERYGIRRVSDHDDNWQVGDTARPSQVWDDGIETGEYLDGVSALEVPCPAQTGRPCTVADIAAVLAASNDYIGRPVLLGSMEVTYGVDPGEIVMHDAKVLRRGWAR